MKNVILLAIAAVHAAGATPDIFSYEGYSDFLSSPDTLVFRMIDFHRGDRLSLPKDMRTASQLTSQPRTIASHKLGDSFSLVTALPGSAAGRLRASEPPQTLGGSFSAVSNPIFTTKYALESA